MDDEQVVDLRMVNRALDRLAGMLRADPALADRAARWMRGDLIGGELMPQHGIPVRVPQELVDRAERLLPALQTDAELATVGRVSRSTVIRLALLRGLEVLERRHKPRDNA